MTFLEKRSPSLLGDAWETFGDEEHVVGTCSHREQRTRTGMRGWGGPLSCRSLEEYRGQSYHLPLPLRVPEIFRSKAFNNLR